MEVDTETIVDDKTLTKNAAIQIASTLFHYKWIAAAVGISEDTMKRYRDEDQEFADSIDRERARFIAKNVSKAKPEFLLQTADRATFGEQKKVIIEDSMDRLLEAYGVTQDGKLIEEGGNDREIDEPVQSSSQDQA